MADDTATLQTLFGSTTYDVVLEPKTYFVSDTLSIPCSKHVRGVRGLTKIVFRQTSGTAAKAAINFTGAAPGSKLANFVLDYSAGAAATSAPYAILQCDGRSNRTLTGLIIDGVEINGNKTLQSVLQTGIDAVGIDDLTIQNCYVHDVRGNCMTLSYHNNLLVTRNRFYGWGDDYIGLFVVGSPTEQNHDWTIDGNQFDMSSWPTGAAVRSGEMQLRGDPVQLVRRVSCINNKCLGIKQRQETFDGYCIFNAEDVTVTGNSKLYGGAGISIGGRNYTVTGNSMNQLTFWSIEAGISGYIGGNSIIGNGSTTVGVGIFPNGGLNNDLTIGHNFYQNVSREVFVHGFVPTNLRIADAAPLWHK